MAKTQFAMQPIEEDTEVSAAQLKQYNRAASVFFKPQESDGDEHSHASEGWGRGILADVKRTVGTHWWSEMKNFNVKTIGVSFFLFVAVIAPSITFGAVYSKRTNGFMGPVELLLGTAWCGVFYSLVSGMPMMINGATGPVLTFQAVSYELSKQIDVPFLTFNAWVGLWVAFYMLLAAFFDLNRFIKYASRFTDEVSQLLLLISRSPFFSNTTAGLCGAHYLYIYL